jgi:outer membrane protein assembly factor BamB
MKSGRIFYFVTFLFLYLANAGAQDWTQYQGNTRNGISTHQGILRSWPAEGPQIMWTAALGAGNGGPIARDGKVYLLDRDDKTGDIMRCFDLSTGKELWNYSYEAPGTVRFPGSRSVPAIDGNYIYSCGHNGDLYCIDITTHKAVWNRNIWKDFGGAAIPTWAITQNPLIYNDMVFIASQAPEDYFCNLIPNHYFS